MNSDVDHKAHTGRPHLEALTWLRGFAAFLVIISHTVRVTESTYFGEASYVPFVFKYLDLGNFGVGLFFALSGCTLYLSNGRIGNATDVALFYFRRWMRIWPTFVISLLVYMLFMKFFETFYPLRDGHWVERSLLVEYSVQDLFKYIALVFNVTGPEEYFNGAFWSLPVEFQYYLLFPIILLSLRRTSLVGPIAICGALYLAWWFGLFRPDRHEVLSLAYVFGGGMICGYIYERINFRIPPWIALASLAMLLLVISLVRHDIIPLLPIPPFGRKWDWFGSISVVMTAIVLFAEVNSIKGKLRKFFTHYGDISYSTYLYHNIFIAISAIIIVRFNIEIEYRSAMTFILTLICTYMLAVVSHKWVEMPSIVVGRNVAKKFKAKNR